jgi:hypothetical protein
MPGADNVSALPKRGYTFYGDKTPPTTYGQSVSVEGTFKTFNNETVSTSGGVTTLRDNQKIECILVRNASTISLLPGRVVTWQANYHRRRVDGYARLDFTGAIAGVVDDQLPAAGAQAGDLFWVMVKGPALVKTSLGADVQSFAATSNVTNAVSAIFNRIGLALSAKTTSNTNANVSVDLMLMP